MNELVVTGSLRLMCPLQLQEASWGIRYSLRCRGMPGPMLRSLTSRMRLDQPCMCHASAGQAQ